MISFNEFVENKRADGAIVECASIMVEMDVEPHRYIYESLKEVDPVLAESWWDGVKSFAGNAWNAAKQVGKGVWDGGGLKHGLAQAADTVAGPVAKFDSAVRALESLKKTLSDPKFSNFQSSTGKGTVADYISIILHHLNKDKAAMPQMGAAQVSQSYDTRGNLAGAQAPASAPKASPAAVPNNSSVWTSASGATS